MINKNKKKFLIRNFLGFSKEPKGGGFQSFENQKHGQSETVGFIIIMVIVMVIVLVFMWFLFKPENNYMPTSVQMSNLLSASMYSTSNCSTSFIPQYKTGQELVKTCFSYAGEQCLDGRNVCQALNDTLKETVGDVLDVNEDSPIKAYKITIAYHVPNSDEPDKTFMQIGEGNFKNCTSRYGGSNSIFSGSGSIEVRIQVCQGK